VPFSRHLSDEVIRAVSERGGVIGLVLYNGFLEPRWHDHRGTVVSLSNQFRQQAEYMARLAGWEHIGIGSDLDGGFGKEESPVEIDTVADLHRIGSVLPAEAREGVLGTNWLGFLRKALPRSS
jgi:membrane dipeptidase